MTTLLKRQDIQPLPTDALLERYFKICESMSKANKKYKEKDEVKEKLKIKMREKRQDPEFREKERLRKKELKDLQKQNKP